MTDDTPTRVYHAAYTAALDAYTAALDADTAALDAYTAARAAAREAQDDVEVEL